MNEPKTEIVRISTPVEHYTLDLESGTIQVKPIITNADRIRSMTDEELARFIAGQRGWFCDFKDPTDEEYPKVLDWLKQEAKR